MRERERVEYYADFHEKINIYVMKFIISLLLVNKQIWIYIFARN